ncbi:MAG: hypothetical protein H6632_19660 [Anaerolineales bacterium]|nr:hypothetical protein [Anaerolineales bacterium]
MASNDSPQTQTPTIPGQAAAEVAANGSDLAHSLWRRYGDSPGLIRNTFAPGLVQRLSRPGGARFSLLTAVQRRWLPAAAFATSPGGELPYLQRFAVAEAYAQPTGAGLTRPVVQPDSMLAPVSLAEQPDAGPTRPIVTPSPTRFPSWPDEGQPPIRRKTSLPETELPASSRGSTIRPKQASDATISSERSETPPRPMTNSPQVSASGTIDPPSSVSKTLAQPEDARQGSEVSNTTPQQSIQEHPAEPLVQTKFEASRAEGPSQRPWLKKVVQSLPDSDPVPAAQRRAESAAMPADQATIGDIDTPSTTVQLNQLAGPTLQTMLVSQEVRLPAKPPELIHTQSTAASNLSADSSQTAEPDRRPVAAQAQAENAATTNVDILSAAILQRYLDSPAGPAIQARFTTTIPTLALERPRQSQIQPAAAQTGGATTFSEDNLSAAILQRYLDSPAGPAIQARFTTTTPTSTLGRWLLGQARPVEPTTAPKETVALFGTERGDRTGEVQPGVNPAPSPAEPGPSRVGDSGPANLQREFDSASLPIIRLNPASTAPRPDQKRTLAQLEPFLQRETVSGVGPARGWAGTLPGPLPPVGRTQFANGQLRAAPTEPRLASPAGKYGFELPLVTAAPTDQVISRHIETSMAPLIGGPATPPNIQTAVGATPEPISASGAVSQSEIDLAALVEQVLRQLGRRLSIERERRGVERWH